MGRSGRLAIGAIAAAVCAGQVAPTHLLAGVALAMAAVLLLAQAATDGLGSRARAGRDRGGAARRPDRWPRRPDRPSSTCRRTATGHGRSPSSPPARRARDSRPRPSARRPERLPRSRSPPRFPATPSSFPAIESSSVASIRERPESPYGTYLARIGAVGTLTSRTLELEPGSDDPGRRLEAIRRGAAEGLAVVLPEPEAGLAAGILIGLRDRVDRDLAAAFTTAGVSHVVAISGWNIAIVAAAIGAASGRLGRRRRSIVTVVAIVVYVAFAGGSPSVVRAALMAGVVLLARESGRAGRATAALGWAATLLLLADPVPDRRCGVPAVVARDRGADRVGDAVDRTDRRRHAGPVAAGDQREPRRVARGPGRDAPDHPRLVRPAGDPVADRQPRRRAARRAGDGGRARRARGGCGRARRRAIDRRGDRGRAGLGHPPAARHDRRRGGEPAIRERDPRSAVRRGGGDARDRRRGRDRMADAEGGRGSTVVGPPPAPADPVPSRAPGLPGSSTRGATGRNLGCPSRQRGRPGRRAARRRRPRRLAAALPRPGVRSSTSGRAMRSWSKARAAVACSSMAAPTRIGSSWRSTSTSRRGIGGSTS